MSRLRAVSSIIKRKKSLRDEIYKPKETYLGTEIEPVHTGLPKTTRSLCPECKRIIPARVFEEDGKVMMEKTCPEHGYFKDIVFSDVDFYLRMEEWFFGDGNGLINPLVTDATTCPHDCGLCNLHTSHTALGNIDLTNRCNLRCPICFANANASGYLYEPSYEQIVQMLRNFRDMKPVPAACVQFSGGEPTVHPHFLDVVQTAKNMGFSVVQIATNGIKFADLSFATRAREAGVHSLYLQFDGTSDDIYKQTRGRPLLETKLSVIENCRKTGMKIVFVPTIAKGVNDYEVGNILKLAIENVDVVSGVSYQPIAFTGRFSREERENMRFTLPDLARCIEEQVGFVKAKDWVPLTCSSPLSRMFGSINGREITTYTCHPHCSAATYLFVDDNGNATQFTDFVDFKGMLEEIDMLARRTGMSRRKILSTARFFIVLRKHFSAKKAPEGLTFMKFIRTLYELTGNKYERDESKIGKNTYRTIMIGGMHFMDAYNYDVQRVQRCVVHYAAPNGRIYPFCSYNSGPVYREQIEREFSVPYDKTVNNSD
jgi:uncharacterized radical SAM superfamily Fe-S cluster-containing enzyme